MNFRKLVKRLKRYRAEISIGISSAIVGVIASRVADVVFEAPTTYRLQLFLLAMNLAFLVSLAFVIKRNVTGRIVFLQDRVAKLIGRNYPTQYDDRKTHFAEEKSKLIEYLVRTELPRLIAEAVAKKEREREDKKREEAKNDLGIHESGAREEAKLEPIAVRIIVDSGTTLEPFFRRLRQRGLGRKIQDDIINRVEIFTNSLSGSNAFCKETGGELEEEQLHLFGGNPAGKYRAVMGPVTEQAISDLGQRTKDQGGVLIGLITANWFVVGSGYDRLIVCSSEPWHLSIKETMAGVCDYLIVVSPLGKLLRLHSVDRLNEILNRKEEGEQPYKGFDVTKFPAEVRLLTTSRESTRSLLSSHWNSLESASKHRSNYKYDLIDGGRALQYDPRVPHQEQREIEMPHHYLHDKAEEALQVSK